jgi:hypothetical protein
MTHDLTDQQLQVLRWIIEQVKNKALEETFFVVSMPTGVDPNAIVINGISELPDYVHLGTLNALANFEPKILIQKQTRLGIRHTLTRAAYEISAEKLRPGTDWPQYPETT